MTQVTILLEKLRQILNEQSGCSDVHKINLFLLYLERGLERIEDKQRNNKLEMQVFQLLKSWKKKNKFAHIKNTVFLQSRL